MSEQKKQPKRKRDIKISVWVTKTEYTKIKEFAERANSRSVSDYIRRLILNGKIIHIDYSALNEFTFQLRHIGINLNQIAKIGNTDKAFSLKDIQMIQNAVKKIESVLSELQKKLDKSERKIKSNVKLE